MPPKLTTRQRFMQYVNLERDECWWWTGGVRNKHVKFPRPVFKLEGRSQTAARVILNNGPIPDGLIICHTCDNSMCVNPDHLYAGTHKDNFEDAVQRERLTPLNGTPHNAFELNSHCSNGHEITSDSVYSYKKNGETVRRCRQCKRDSQKRYRQNRKKRESKT